MGLYLTVFLTGAAVMVIELLGTRLIAPFYGASLYVWSSLISVTLMALAAGYFCGGRWADRSGSASLSLVVALAGATTLAIPWITRPVLLATDPLGLRLGAFVSALIMFSPALVLLGMVGPFVVRLSTSRLDGVGASAGSTYAVSTLGSVIGTLLLGFFLFPRIGSRSILIGLGILLLLLAVALAVGERRRLADARGTMRTGVGVALGVAVLTQVVGSEAADATHTALRIRSEQESLYGWVRVLDDEAHDLRILATDASAIGAASISTGKSRLGYQEIVDLVPQLAPGMKRALVIGLGAGHMATLLHDRHRIVTDTLEIDPAVSAAAHEWFGFRDTGVNVIGDARYEMRRLRGPYDLIIHDCFTGGSEPAHLLTEETLSHLHGLLAPHGMLVLNFVALLRDGRDTALASVVRTVAEVFPRYRVFIAEPGRDFNDFIVLASDDPIDSRSPPLDAARSAWLRRREFPVDPDQGVLLTDDFNPLEHLQTAKAEQYRRFVADWLGPKVLVR